MGQIISILVILIFSAFPTGLALGKLLDGRDIRTLGSGNIGGTNVGRVYGKFWGIWVIIVDALKAAFVVSFSETLNIFQNFNSEEMFLAKIGIGIFVILINIFNPFLGFKGGKGVATSIGVLVELDWQIAVLSFGAFLLMFATQKFKRSDLFKGSLVGACTALACSIALLRPIPEIILFIFAVPLIFYSHRENINTYKKSLKKPLN